jgi:hypothetical protein
MEDLSRRTFLGLAAAGLTTGFWDSKCSYGSESIVRKQKVPVLHVTDLFRPHNDPDDHWDLACVYALAHQGDIDLKGILIDYPPISWPSRR